MVAGLVTITEVDSLTSEVLRNFSASFTELSPARFVGDLLEFFYSR